MNLKSKPFRHPLLCSAAEGAFFERTMFYRCMAQ